MPDLARRRRPSRQARQQRDRRRIAARAGSARDKLIAIARMVLPLSVAVLAGFLTLAPLIGGRDISFVLSRDRVAVASERMRVGNAVYRGQDGRGRPFRLTARSAVQHSAADPVVRMQDLTAAIELDHGPATFVAPRGRYDMDHQHVDIDGPVSFKGPGGYRMDTHDVGVNLATHTAVSGAAVSGSTDMGTFRAERMTANLDTRVIQLDGRVRLHIPHPRAK